MDRDIQYIDHVTCCDAFTFALDKASAAERMTQKKSWEKSEWTLSHHDVFLTYEFPMISVKGCVIAVGGMSVTLVGLQ